MIFLNSNEMSNIALICVYFCEKKLLFSVIFLEKCHFLFKLSTFSKTLYKKKENKFRFSNFRIHVKLLSMKMNKILYFLKIDYFQDDFLWF